MRRYNLVDMDEGVYARIWTSAATTAFLASTFDSTPVYSVNEELKERR